MHSPRSPHPSIFVRRPRLWFAGLLGAVLLLSTIGTSAGSIYLKIAGLTGEVTAPGFAGTTGAYSFSYGAANPTTLTSMGVTPGRPTLSDVSVARSVGSLSPTLFLWMVTGKVIPTVNIYFTKTVSGVEKTYMQIDLSSAYVTNQTTSGSGSDVPTESLSFAYQKITITFTPDDANSQPTTVTYDVTTGTK